MPINRKDWWLTVVAAAALVIFGRMVPRYQWHDPGGDNPRVYVRVDRWTGRATVGEFTHIEGAPAGAWQSYEAMRRAAAAGLEIALPSYALSRLIRDNRELQDRILRHPDGILGVLDEVIGAEKEAPQEK